MEGKHIAGTAIGAVIKVVVAAVVILYVYRFTLTAYDYGYRLFGEPPVSEEPGITVTVAVLEGSSAKDIGKLLEEKGLIRDAGLFFWQEKLSGHAGKIQPGVYELNTSMTAEEMIEAMAETEDAEGETAEEDARSGAPGEDAGETEEGTSAADAGDDEGTAESVE